MSDVRIQTVVSEKGRRIVGRLLPGTDLIKGIKKVCWHHDTVYGNIFSIIGSLTEAKIAYAVGDQTGKIGIYKSSRIIPTNSTKKGERKWQISILAA
jgi:hypothetical protein